MTVDLAWRRLAEHVIARRNALNLTQEDVRAIGGPSTATMRLIEGALQNSYRPSVLGRLEKALQWAPGSVGHILRGGEPTTVSPSAAHHTAAGDPDWERRTVARIRATDVLTSDQKLARIALVHRIASERRSIDEELDELEA